MELAYAGRVFQTFNNSTSPACTVLPNNLLWTLPSSFSANNCQLACLFCSLLRGAHLPFSTARYVCGGCHPPWLRWWHATSQKGWGARSRFDLDWGYLRIREGDSLFQTRVIVVEGGGCWDTTWKFGSGTDEHPQHYSKVCAKVLSRLWSCSGQVSVSRIPIETRRTTKDDEEKKNKQKGFKGSSTGPPGEEIPRVSLRDLRGEKLDDGWPESVEEQGLLLLVWRHNCTNNIWKMCYRQSRRGVARQNSENLHRKHFYTQTLLHTKAFTHRSFYTQKLLHRGYYTQSFYPQKLLHTDAFTHRCFYTQTLLHGHCYTQTRLHTDTFTHRPFYTQELLLHTNALTHRSFYT